MKSLVRAMWVWLVLGGLSWSLATGANGDLVDPVAPLVLLVLLAAAIWLTAIAVSGDHRPSRGRAVVLATIVFAWFATLLVVQGRAEANLSERKTLLIACGLAILVAVGIVVKTRAYPRWPTVRGLAVALALPAVAGEIFLRCHEMRTKSLIARAEQRWSEIGMPLADLDKSLLPTRENDGATALRKTLREEVGCVYYKVGTRAAEKEQAIGNTQPTDRLVQQAVGLLDVRPPADDVDLTGKRTDLLEAMAPAFDANYRQILATEPPTWQTNPRDGYHLDLPNFLALRKFAQVTGADALRRLSVGDQEGAARALDAGLHITSGVRQGPTLVSLMISIAVDAMLYAKQVYLPATNDDAFQAIAQDSKAYHTEILRHLRLEAWTTLRFTDQITELMMTGYLHPKIGFLPHWTQELIARPLAKRQAAIAALNDAEHAAIQQSLEKTPLPDFGASRHDAVSQANSTMMEMEFNVTRAVWRTQATLLLREQVELIRQARALLAEGKPLEGRKSVVIPNARWELTTDAEKNSVTTRLVGVPDWVVKGDVTGKDFWMIPLDGSVAWKFHQPARTTQQ